MSVFDVATRRFGGFPVVTKSVTDPSPSPSPSPPPEPEEARPDPVPKHVVVFHCQGCRRYEVSHGIHWCFHDRSWRNVARLFGCPGREAPQHF